MLVSHFQEGPHKENNFRIYHDDYASSKLVGELRPGDLICYFYYPKAFGDIAGLVWDRITAIRTYQSKVYGPGAEVCIAGSHPVSYEHH